MFVLKVAHLGWRDDLTVKGQAHSQKSKCPILELGVGQWVEWLVHSELRPQPGMSMR